MTQNIRNLLAQIATFESMNKAGLSPLPGELVAFFQTAQLARLDVRAFDSGMPLPGERPTPAAPRPVAFERLDGEVVELTARVPLASMARAVIEQLGPLRDGVKRKGIVIGGGPC